MAVKIRNAGFKGMKIRSWRPNPMDDVEVCRLIKEATGAGLPHHVRSHCAGSGHGFRTTGLGFRNWSESSPRTAEGWRHTGWKSHFHRDDYESPARLASHGRYADHWRRRLLHLENYKQCLLHRTYDILQPDGRTCGGIFRARKIRLLAESFHVPVILHGSISLPLAGWLQATLAIGAPWQEMALLTPPLLPDEQTSPGLKLLKSSSMFRIEDGDLSRLPTPASDWMSMKMPSSATEFVTSVGRQN